MVNSEVNRDTQPEQTLPEKDATAPSNQSGKQPLFSNPAVPMTEEYGEWMKVARTTRQRQPKQAYEGGSQGKQGGDFRKSETEQRPYKGNRFDALREEDKPVKSVREPQGSTSKEPATEWRRRTAQKDASSEPSRKGNPERMTESEGREKMEIEAGNEAGKRKLNDAGNEAESSRREKETEERFDFKGSKWTPHFDVNSVKPSPIVNGLHQGTRKRVEAARPKITPPLFKKKQVNRTHKVIIGSISNSGLQEMEVMHGQKGQELDTTLGLLTNDPVPRSLHFLGPQQREGEMKTLSNVGTPTETSPELQEVNL